MLRVSQLYDNNFDLRYLKTIHAELSETALNR